MLEGYQIFLIVFGSIVGFYLLIVIMDVIFLFAFRNILNTHSKSLEVFLHLKYDNIKKLIDIVQKEEGAIDSKILESFSSIDPACFSNQEDPECLRARGVLSSLRIDLVCLIDKDEKLAKSKNVLDAKKAIVEMDSNYRTLIAMYNADVLGYNYWLRFLPTRFIYKLLKKETKQIIA